MTVKLLKLLATTAIFGALFAHFSAAAHGGDDRGHGDWFIKPLPILKIQIPEDGGDVEGVHYSRMDLPLCSDISFRVRNPRYEVTSYFPGRNFAAVKVQISFNNIICSYGVVERDPDKALLILVNNPQTNTDYDFQGTTIYSKSFGGPAVAGNFLVAPGASDKLILFGNGRMNQAGKLYAWSGPIDSFDPKRADVIYLPTAIQPSSRVYFGNLDPISGRWTLLLPVAYEPGAIPLQRIATDLKKGSVAKDSTFADLINIVELPKGFPNGYQAPSDTVAQIWMSYLFSSPDSALRNAVYKSYDIPVHEDQLVDYPRLRVLSERFQFKFAPTIDIADIHRASYHRSGRRLEIELPLMNPSWRVVGDMVHEMTHALQKPNPSGSDDITFQNEMEAHLNERAYLQEVSERFPALKLLIANYNFIEAASVAKVEFVFSDGALDSSPLCSEVIRAYRLDPAKISASSLKRFGCN